MSIELRVENVQLGIDYICKNNLFRLKAGENFTSALYSGISFPSDTLGIKGENIASGLALACSWKNSNFCQVATALWAINSDKIWIRRLCFHHFLVFCR